jgi:hypothetical protein
MKKFLVFLGVVLLVLIAVGIARLVTGPAKENARGKQGLESTQSARVANPLVTSPCGPGLAAQDLAGVCRAKPSPTPGALEAMGDTRRSEIKHQPKPMSKNINSSF